MRLTPGGPLPSGAPIRVVSGEYEGFEGTIYGHRADDGTLTRYNVTIKQPDEDEGMEFNIDVPASAVQLRGSR